MTQYKPLSIGDGPTVLDLIMSLLEGRKVKFEFGSKGLHFRSSNPSAKIIFMRRLEHSETKSLGVEHQLPDLNFEIQTRLYHPEFSNMRFFYSTRTRKGVILEIS